MKTYKTLFLTLLLFVSQSGCDFVADLATGSDDGNGMSDVSGFENLGSGYDVFDNYADVEKVKGSILDTKAMNRAGLIEKKVLEKSVFETSSGTTISEYSSNLRVKASLEGSSMYFSGAIKTNFSESRYKSEEYSFATVHSSINKYILRVDLGYSGADLSQYLTAQADSVFNDPTVDPHTVFRIYGTHVLTGIIVGGRLDFNISARTSDLSGSKSIGVYAQASFKSSFSSADVSIDVLSDSEWASYNNSREERLEIYGGASEYGQFIINDGEYAQWIDSIQENLIFANFTSSGAMIPIWDFVDLPARREQLIAGFATWAEARKIITTPAPKDAIINLLVKFAGNNNFSSTIVEGGLTYHQLPIDLNADAGGDFIYLYYAIGPDDGSVGPPVQYMYTWNRSDGEGQVPGVPIIMIDLNRRASGDDIFLGVQRGFTLPTIRGVRIHNASTGTNVYSAGTDGNNRWIGINEQGNSNLQDMNENAGGDDVFIYYTHDEI